MASYDMETPPTASSARAGNTVEKSIVTHLVRNRRSYGARLK